MFIASLRTTAAISLVFSDTLIKAGGWVGLATAVAAWYASFAAVTNSMFGRVVLPVMPLKR
jgi:uncharacterized protein